MERLSNPYASAPPTPPVLPDEARRKWELHEEAARLILRAQTYQDAMLAALNEAARTLDLADGYYDGEDGLDSRSSRAAVANMADAVELHNLDNLADEVRSLTR